METVYYDFPAYAGEIIARLKKNDWFIHSFGLSDKSDIYNPAAYLYNGEFYDKKYVVHLDLNIYQYVISAFKKTKKNQLHRDAIAFMVFGKFTNIMFDPTIAVYEKLNYLETCPDELLDDLYLFRQIDNAEMDKLAEFALGFRDDLSVPAIDSIDKEQLNFKLTEYRRLKKWDTFYLFVLKVTNLYFYDNQSNAEKLNSFMNWCFTDFLYSIVSISFVIRLMGKQPLPKLMKYKPSDSTSKKKSALVNMTWDLFLLDKFFEHWRNKKPDSEFIYASNDKPLKEVLEIAISIQEAGGGDHLTKHLSPCLISTINILNDLMEVTEGRKITGVADFKEFRDMLIAENEAILLCGE